MGRFTVIRTSRPSNATDPRAEALGVGRWIVVAALILLFLGLLVFRSDCLPMQIWDESRNANNALAMSQNGHWLTPTYNGAIDHWNTKPPLLIWGIAGLLKVGLPPLWALRIPSMVAALATLGLIWSVLRYALRDFTAASIACTLLLTSLTYVGPHAARTGDYDASESLFVLGYVLTFWAAFTGSRPRANWLFGTALCLFGAVMTKGVAGGLATPGLVIFALSRPNRLLDLLKDVRTWLAALAAAALCIGYYLTRELYDHGYLQAVLANEIGGRFTSVNEGHSAGKLLYFRVLLKGFEPGLLLLPLGLIPVVRGTGDRRSLAWITGVCGVVLLIVLSLAKTKLAWYATPLIPLFSITAALGLSDLLLWVRSRREYYDLVLSSAIALVLTIFATLALHHNWKLPQHDSIAAGRQQFWYGRFLQGLDTRSPSPPLIAVDSGLPNTAHFANYNPMLLFYADLLSRKGSTVTIQPPGKPLAPGSRVATCDARSLAWLERTYALAIRVRDPFCIEARVDAAR